MRRGKNYEEPDLTTPLAGRELIPESEFHDKMKAIFGPGGVTKEEVDAHEKEHPEPAAKRGRPPKNKDQE